MTASRGSRWWLGAAIALVASIVFASPAGAAGCAGPVSDAELRHVEGVLASKVNAERAARGLGSLAIRSDLVGFARPHAGVMAGAGTIFHNGAYFDSIGALGATMLAENVGTACSAESVHAAFMASPSHRANILHGELTHVGYGAAADPTGQLFVVQSFAAYPAAPAPAAPAPAPPAPVKAEPQQAATTKAPAPSKAPAPAPDPTPTAQPATPQPTEEPVGVASAEPLERTLLATGSVVPVASSPRQETSSEPVRGSVPFPLAPAAAALCLVAALVATVGGRRPSRAPRWEPARA